MGTEAIHMRASTFGRLGALAIAVIAAAWLGQYTYSGAPDLPFWDAWGWIADIPSYRDGDSVAVLRKGMLSQNEHLYLLPALVFRTTASVFGYSLRPYAYLSVVLFVCLGALLSRVAVSAGAGIGGALLVFLVAVSFRHFENLLLGFQFGLVLSVFAGTAAIWIADEYQTASGFSIALALALASLLSSAAGVFSLVLVVAVHHFDVKNPRKWLIAVSLLAVLMVATGAALYAFDVRFYQFVHLFLRALVAQSAALAIVDWIKVMGGGLIGGKFAAAVGFIGIGWLVSCIADDVRARHRLAAPSAIALFSLLSTFAVAWGRSPITEPASRWAVFALPGTAMAIVWLFARIVPRVEGGRVRVGIPVALLWVWLTASNFVDAAGYRNYIEQWAFELRTYLAYHNAGEPLTKEQLGRFNPAIPELMRRILSIYKEVRPQAFRDGIELATQLPSSVAGEAVVSMDGGVLRVAGPGYVHSRHVCVDETGCVVRLIATVEAQGAATLGIIVRSPAGVQRANENITIPADGKPQVQTISADVANGEQVDPYVFCYTTNDRARIRSFSVVVIRRHPTATAN